MKSKGKQGPCTSKPQGESQTKLQNVDDGGKEAYFKNAHFLFLSLQLVNATFFIPLSPVGQRHIFSLYPTLPNVPNHMMHMGYAKEEY